MKTTIICTIIISTVLNSSTSTEHKQDQDDFQLPHHLVSLLQRCTNTCKAKTKVTHEDIACIKDNKIPESRAGLCFLQCMMEKLGIVVKNKFLKNAVITTFAPVVKNSPEKKNLLRKASEECAEELKKCTVEQCGDMAYHILKCFERHKADFNFITPLSQIKF